ncbi:malto-oligosyltrehalose trehalohydrolase [Tersicoccus phoenicis]|uniref:Malto-oligosyltrehalose trehalohydrolase n=1 Tax=Tersicoccus phoenicis TaxID=554083 RepID=A0A1R1L6P6_9MICC|nr:malto-oligosyltrehalose trehalohydrolase [Tersicoccus phoenicis]OMH23207.1 malto-oligosyltrehalose trehalohydrolase [Tersicoccus phoenicis]
MNRNRFDVWAPFAEQVTLRADGRDLPMHRAGSDGAEDASSGSGWWTLASADAPTGEVDYGYLLDDDPTPLPDPRSRRQPDGVHGLSRTVDPSSHRWSDGTWAGRRLAGSVLYELHLGTFTPEGTLDAAIDRLDHLVDLGVHAIELLPVNGFNGEHNWGYDGVAWFTVAEVYGGPAAYQRFVDAAHGRGLAVIQDVVYNHLGPSGNYLGRFGPYLHSSAVNPWGDSMNLDGTDSDEVRAYILDNVAMWLGDYHVDGLRLDAVHALEDRRAVHLLEEINRVVDTIGVATGKPLFAVAESDLNDPRMITPRTEHGLGCAGQWSDDFHHAVHAAVTGETVGYYADFAPLSALAKVLRDGFFHDGTYSSFRGRHHGRPIDPFTTPAWRLVTCIQNHDQVGNRATGDRLSATLPYDRLAVAAVLNLTAPFTPMLFMGEEWGASTPWQFFTAHPEPELGEAVSKGRTSEFAQMGWDESTVPDPQAPSTFTNSKLNWAEAADGDHARLLALYRSLIDLRQATPELTQPDFRSISVDFSEEERWLVLRRAGIAGAGDVVVAVNLGSSERSVPVGDVDEVLLSTVEGGLAHGDAGMPGWSAVVLRTSI